MRGQRGRGGRGGARPPAGPPADSPGDVRAVLQPVEHPSIVRPPGQRARPSPVAVLHQRLQRLARALASLEEDVDRMSSELDELLQRLRTHAFAVRPRGDAAPTLLAPDAPRVGTVQMYLSPREDGSAEVQIGQSPWFTVPPLIRELLEILAAPVAGLAHGGGGGWQSCDRILAALRERAGRPVSRRGLAVLVARLRQRMRAAGIVPTFVQVHRLRGLRFAACVHVSKTPPSAR